MPARNDDDDERPETWWQAIPSSIKALSGLIVAVAGLITALAAAGIIKGNPPDPGPITVTIPAPNPTDTPFRTSIASLTVENIATPTGQYAANGRQIWQWTIFLQGPRAELDQVQCVIYGLDPGTFRPAEYSQCARGSDQYAFPFTANGWGVFEVQVLIQARSGETREMKHLLHFP
jgi:hypothetical protein